jgi:hypothetical protein
MPKLPMTPPLARHRLSARAPILALGMPANRLNVDAVEQPVQLLRRQRQYRLLAPRPVEFVFFEAFKTIKNPERS